MGSILGNQLTFDGLIVQALISQKKFSFRHPAVVSIPVKTFVSQLFYVLMWQSYVQTSSVHIAVLWHTLFFVMWYNLANFFYLTPTEHSTILACVAGNGFVVIASVVIETLFHNVFMLCLQGARASYQNPDDLLTPILTMLLVDFFKALIFSFMDFLVIQPPVEKFQGEQNTLYSRASSTQAVKHLFRIMVSAWLTMANSTVICLSRRATQPIGGGIRSPKRFDKSSYNKGKSL